MSRIYFIGAIGAMVFGAFYAGTQIARAKCRADMADAQTNELITQLDKKRKIDDKVFHTAVRDIRHILREKYTISD